MERDTLNSSLIVSHAAVMQAVTASHIPIKICLMASHAPCQLPVNTEDIKSTMPLTILRKEFAIFPMESHNTLNQTSIWAPQVLQNISTPLNMATITAAMAAKIVLPASHNVFHMPGRVLAIICHILTRKSFIFLKASKTACRALPAPIPKLSKIVPMTESFPRRKCIKSSAIKTSAAITATAASTFRLAKENIFPIPDISFKNIPAPDIILLQFIAKKNAPATTARIFSMFSTPPSFPTTPFTTSMPRFIPLENVWVILSTAGCRRLTNAWYLSVALVRTPFSAASPSTAFVALCVKDTRSLSTATAGCKIGPPAAAFRSFSDCLRLPS